MQEPSDLTVDQLLDVDWYKNHKGVPQRIIKEAFSRALQNPHVVLFRQGDTILVVDTLLKDFHFINAASFNDFIDNVPILLKECGEKVMHTNFTNPLIIEVAKLTKTNFTLIKDGEDYLMTVRL